MSGYIVTVIDHAVTVIGHRLELTYSQLQRPFFDLGSAGSAHNQIGPWAFKLARGKRGVQCNRHEADLFLRNKAKAHRRSMLCCVLWCSWPAVVLIMRRAATPITGAQLQALKAAAWSKWDYLGPGDDECPFEWKLDDWGTLNGRLVAVDYAATARDQFPRLRE